MPSLYRRAAYPLSRLSASVRKRGLVATAQLCATFLLFHARAWSPDQIRAAHSETSFDRTHGTDTSGRVRLAGLDIAAASKAGGYTYAPVNPWLFGRIVRRLPINPASFAFVDIGSGKGRAVLLASLHSFREAVGVEFARELYEAASRNASAWRARHPALPPIRFDHADALVWPLPEVPAVLFLCNPFGPEVFSGLLQKIQHSLARQPRETYLLYYCPRHRDIPDGLPFLRRVQESWRFDYVFYAIG